MSMINQHVLITLVGGRQLSGKIIDEDQFTLTLREGPNPDYSSRPPIIIQRSTIETIQITRQVA